MRLFLNSDRTIFKHVHNRHLHNIKHPIVFTIYSRRL